MPLELESKIAIPSHEPLRQKLRAASATPHGRALEKNILLDSPDQALFHSGCGLRIRTATPIDGDKSPPHSTFTFKGPQEKSTFKRREEIELAINSPDGLSRLLAALDYTPWLTYEKRRESWQLGPCKIELDELPALGRFVEIEGPDDDAIHAALTTLGLADEPSITQSYPALIAAHLGESAPRPLTLRF